METTYQELTGSDPDIATNRFRIAGKDLPKFRLLCAIDIWHISRTDWEVIEGDIVRLVFVGTV